MRANAKCIKNQGRHIHFKGRQSPSYTSHCYVKSNKELSNKNPIKPPTDQGQPPRNRVTKVSTYLHMLLFLISCDFHSIMSTKNVPSSPCFIEAFEEGFGWVDANLTKLNNPSSSYLGVHNEIIPNKVSRDGLMLLLMVGHAAWRYRPKRCMPSIHWEWWPCAKWTRWGQHFCGSKLGPKPKTNRTCRSLGVSLATCQLPY